jgi:hypothetical protein
MQPLRNLAPFLLAALCRAESVTRQDIQTPFGSIEVTIPRFEPRERFRIGLQSSPTGATDKELELNRLRLDHARVRVSGEEYSLIEGTVPAAVPGDGAAVELVIVDSTGRPLAEVTLAPAPVEAPPDGQEPGGPSQLLARQLASLPPPAPPESVAFSGGTFCLAQGSDPISRVTVGGLPVVTVAESRRDYCFRTMRPLIGRHRLLVTRRSGRIGPVTSIDYVSYAVSPAHRGRRSGVQISYQGLPAGFVFTATLVNPALPATALAGGLPQIVSILPVPGRNGEFSQLLPYRVPAASPNSLASFRLTDPTLRVPRRADWILAQCFGQNGELLTTPAEQYFDRLSPTFPSDAQEFHDECLANGGTSKFTLY